jgi:hypothetical protein
LEDDLYIYQFQETAFLEHLATLMGVKQPLVQCLAHKIWNVGYCKSTNGIGLQVVVSFLMKEVEALRGLRSVVVKGIGPAIYLCPPSTIGTHNRTTNVVETSLPIDWRTIQALEQNKIFCRALDDFVSWDKDLGELVTNAGLDGLLSSLAIPQNVTQSELVPSITPEKESELHPYVFKLDEESDRWHIRFSGKDVAKMKNSKTMRLLHVLVGSREIIWEAAELEETAETVIAQNRTEQRESGSSSYDNADVDSVDERDANEGYPSTAQDFVGTYGEERAARVSSRKMNASQGVNVLDKSTPEARILVQAKQAEYDRHIRDAERKCNEASVKHWTRMRQNLDKWEVKVYGRKGRCNYDDDIVGSQNTQKRVVAAAKRGIAAIGYEELPPKTAATIDKQFFIRAAKLEILDARVCPCAVHLRDSMDWVSLAYCPANKAVEWYT